MKLPDLNMHEEQKVTDIDQIVIKKEQELEISEIMDRENWGKYLAEILEKIIYDPQWLVDETIFSNYQVRLNGQELLDLHRALKGGDGLPPTLNDILGDSSAMDAITIRVMEVFAEKFGFTHVYRGGSLSNLTGGLSGTFTFDPEEAKRFVKRSYDGERKDPCLFALPVSAIVDFYKQNKGNVGFWAEHGRDEVFNHSFDIYMTNHVPEDLTIYVLEGKDPEVSVEAKPAEEIIGLRKKMRMGAVKVRRPH